MEAKAGISEIINKYRNDVEALVKYLPWLERSSGQKMVNNVTPEGGENTMKVPVYDSTLLSFVKVANKTKFMNRNYMYTYTRNRLRTVDDELKYISRAQLTDIQGLGDILSKYVLKGMQRGILWSEAVKDGVFLSVVSKMKELIEFWSVPM